jgi:NAD(P)-dependent dehydrogenase (short-subunit alcohol dehydrogenase family)
VELEPGRVAVITGGASGIGLALAEALGACGLRIVLADVNPALLGTVTADLRAAGVEVTPVVADVADYDAVERLAGVAFEAGRVQVVCSNAGIVSLGRTWEISGPVWERVMNVNFMATVHLVRAFLPRLIEEGMSARLLVTGSMACVLARPEIGPYTAAKHAILGLCETLGHELAQTGAPIGVTLMMPGKVATGMSREDVPDAIPASAVAEQALDAIRRDQAFLFTNPDRVSEVAERFSRILAEEMPARPV